MRWYSVTHFSCLCWYAYVLHTQGEITCCYMYWYLHMIDHSFTYLPSLLLLLQLTIQPEDLLPQLPNPKDLQPFPSVMSMVYEGHTDMVRSIAVEPKGQYMVSGSDDLTVKGKPHLHISVLQIRSQSGVVVICKPSHFSHPLFKSISNLK